MGEDRISTISNGYVGFPTQVSGDYSISWQWSSSGAQSDLEDSLGLFASSLPTLVAINPTQMAFKEAPSGVLSVEKKGRGARLDPNAMDAFLKDMGTGGKSIQVCLCHIFVLYELYTYVQIRTYQKLP